MWLASFWYRQIIVTWSSVSDSDVDSVTALMGSVSQIKQIFIFLIFKLPVNSSPWTVNYKKWFKELSLWIELHWSRCVFLIPQQELVRKSHLFVNWIALVTLYVFWFTKKYSVMSYSVWSQKFTYTLQKMLENQIIFGDLKGFWRTAGSLTVQDKHGTHEQLSLNKKKNTAVDHSGNNTVLMNKVYINFWTGSYYKLIQPLIYLVDYK